jgi:eukaryotic-like serine/threonine-protein kinase
MTLEIKGTALNDTDESMPAGKDDDIGHVHDSVLVAAYRAATVRQSAANAETQRAPRQRVSHDVRSDALMRQICRRYDDLSQGVLPEDAFDFRLTRKLGEGGQGVVRLTECRGSDGFRNHHLALKVFSPRLYPTVDLYEGDMHRIGRVASIVAGIDQGNILNVQRFETFEGVRLMLMKQVEGYDLRHLMSPWSVNRVRETRPDLLPEINQTIASLGNVQTQFKPGAAMTIVRKCLCALDRLHSCGVVYGDIKPSNIMLTPQGDIKIVDIGSAFELSSSQQPFFCTPEYAAPEVMERGECTPRSDLASLGYVLLEMLLGRPLFEHSTRGRGAELSVPQEATTGIAATFDPRLLDEKRSLPDRLDGLLPSYGSTLRLFLQKLIAPNPLDRFPDAWDADVDQKCGCFLYFQELTRGGLNMQYENEFRLWMQALNADFAR